MYKNINISSHSKNDAQPLSPKVAREAHQAYAHKQHIKFIKIVAACKSIEVTTTARRLENLLSEIDVIISDYTKEIQVPPLELKDVLQNPDSIAGAIVRFLDNLEPTKNNIKLAKKLTRNEQIKEKILAAQKHCRNYKKGKFYVATYIDKNGQSKEKHVENLAQAVEIYYRNYEVDRRKEQSGEEFFWVFKSGKKHSSHQAMPVPGRLYVIEKSSSTKGAEKYEARLYRTAKDFENLGKFLNVAKAKLGCEEHYAKKKLKAQNLGATKE